MKSVSITIEGISPLLMHAFPMQPIEALEKKSPEEQAKLCEYRDVSDLHKLAIPSIALQRALISAASYSKGKGRGNLSRIVAACVLVDPQYLTLSHQSYEVDARPVVVPATKGRVIRYRPRFDKWAVSADITYDENLLTEAQLRRVVDDCGSRVGLLDFRPEKRGPFGRFMVTEWGQPVVRR